MNQANEKRLNKFISESGFCSRREADKLIEQNRVTINGSKPELGTKVQPGDTVKVDGKLIHASPENKHDRIYIAYHKPVGITCTTERQIAGNIVDAINHSARIFPIGRLDKPSEGLIFLTSDGDIVNKILRAENAHDKEYIVTVDKPLTDSFIQKMAQGVPILDTVTKPCEVSMRSKFVFRIILTQGLNRQIRRMCEYFGYEVIRLIRTRIMNVQLGNLKAGEWRDLSDNEMTELNSSVANSRKTTSATTLARSTNKAEPNKKATTNNKSIANKKPASRNNTSHKASKNRAENTNTSRKKNSRNQTRNKLSITGRSTKKSKPTRQQTR